MDAAGMMISSWCRTFFSSTLAPRKNTSPRRMMERWTVRDVRKAAPSARRGSAGRIAARPERRGRKNASLRARRKSGLGRGRRLGRWRRGRIDRFIRHRWCFPFERFRDGMAGANRAQWKPCNNRKIHLAHPSRQHQRLPLSCDGTVNCGFRTHGEQSRSRKR